MAGDPSYVGQIGTAEASAAGTTTVVVVGVGGVALGSRVLVLHGSNVLNTDPSPTCADSKGNQYDTIYDSQSAVSARRTMVFEAKIQTPLVSGDTITVTSVSVTRRTIMAREYANVGHSDGGVTATTSTTTTPSTGATPQRSKAKSILVGIMSWTGLAGTETFTAGAGFGSAAQEGEAAASNWRYLGMEHLVFVASGTDAATGTLSTSVSVTAAAIVLPQINDQTGGMAVADEAVDATSII